MAIPRITWYQHSGAADVVGTPIDELTFPTMNAGEWSQPRCISAVVSLADIWSVRFWMYDQTAQYEGYEGTLRAATLQDGDTPWSIRATVQSALSAGMFAQGSAGYGEPVPAFPTYSAGEGLELNDVEAGERTDYIGVVIRPHPDTQGGTYSHWGFQLSFAAEE